MELSLNQASGDFARLYVQPVIIIGIKKLVVRVALGEGPRGH